jgi:hypothetical protein
MGKEEIPTNEKNNEWGTGGNAANQSSHDFAVNDSVKMNQPQGIS